MLDPVIEQLVANLQFLPSVGERSARRMAMQLMTKKDITQQLVHSLTEAIDKIKKCPQCRNFTSQKRCDLCCDEQRSNCRLCVVAGPQDLLALEHSGAFDGKYFVLHGLLSPLDNIDSEQLGIHHFSQSLENIEEVIIALPYTIEGESTCALLIDILEEHNIKVTRLAQGMPTGGEIAGMDQITLNKALLQRKPY